MRTVAALCLLALAMSGCGAAAKDSAKSFSGDKAAVAAVVEDLETAARKNKPDTVCAKLIDAKLLATLKAQGTVCKTGIKEAFEDADSFDLTVDGVTIDGTTATAKVTGGSGSDKKNYTLGFSRTANAWKISSLS